MTKTSTPTPVVKSSTIPAELKAADEAAQQDALFYDSIKSQLDELIKEPSAETINKILAYRIEK